MESSRIDAARARAATAKRVLAVGSAAALGVTFLLVRAHLAGHAASSGAAGSGFARGGEDAQQSQQLGGGLVAPASSDLQPQIQSGTS